MCHRQWSIFHFEKSGTSPKFGTFSRTVPDFKNITREQDPFLTIWSQTSKTPVAFSLMTSPVPIFLKLQLHEAIYRLRFYSNTLIHILSLSNSHNNVASVQKSRSDKSHRVIVALNYVCLLAKDTECVLVTIIINKLWSNKLILPMGALVSCTLLLIYSCKKE